MMKKMTLGFAAVALISAGAVQADPKADLEAFQGYFKKIFPEVPLENYHDGIYALPAGQERAENWKLLLDFPPYDDDVAKGEEMWNAPLKSGKSLADCFKDKPPATGYPYAKDGKVITLEADINACLKANGEEPIKDLKKGKMALLEVAFRKQFNGKKMAVDLSDPAMQKAYEEGKQFYWTKRGQLNFSCANCHVHSAGKKIRGDTLSAGLGQGTGFPVWRQKWNNKGKPWGTLHRRYGGCNKQVRAQPLKPQSHQYIALEVYQAYMNTGVPLKVPSLRQ